MYATVLSTGETVVNIVNWMETEVKDYDFSLAQVGVIVTANDSVAVKDLWTGETT